MAPQIVEMTDRDVGRLTGFAAVAIGAAVLISGHYGVRTDYGADPFWFGLIVMLAGGYSVARR